MRKRTTPLGECSIENCTRTAKYGGTGWCQTHYHRWWRTGDPLGMKQPLHATGSDNVGWKGDDITYWTAHTRVKRAKGSASQHDCVRCGNPATNWAYDHTDPDEKTFESGWGPVQFSPDIERYQPMCRSCHLKMDRGEYGSGWPRRTHCINGHEFDTVNTYIHPRDGAQTCRQCATDRAAAKRAELRARGLSARGKELR